MSLERDGDHYTLVVRIPVLVDFAKGALRVSPDQLAALSLSPVEDKVFRLLLAGKCDKDIAGELLRSVRVVKFHKSRIYKKLGCSGKYEVLARFGGGAARAMLE